jgi:hypothetical protein
MRRRSGKFGPGVSPGRSARVEGGVQNGRSRLRMAALIVAWIFTLLFVYWLVWVFFIRTPM